MHSFSGTNISHTEETEMHVGEKLYVRADIPTREIQDIQVCESIALEITGKDKILLVCVYNPSPAKDAMFQEQFTKALNCTYTRYNKVIVISELNYNFNDQEKEEY